MSALESIKKDLQKLSIKSKAEFFPNFFKIGKGQYGEGGVFIGVTVPNQRIVAKKYYQQVSLEQIKILLDSEIHEHRLTSLLILDLQYHAAAKVKDEKLISTIVDFYLSNTSRVNSWDLVDSSAHKVLGRYLLDKDRALLYKLAKSKNLWEQRISIIATWYFIQNGDIKETFKISELLLNHKHDLIHKAVGWMLREAGKKDEKSLREFLDKHHKVMPRTMLRYSIEKFDEKTRKKYMNRN